MDKQDQDLPVQFPQLQKTEGNFHWVLSIDKSVNKVAGLVLGLLVLIGILSGAALAFALVARDQAIKAETELRLIDDWLVQHGVEKRNGKYVFKEERLDGEEIQ